MRFFVAALLIALTSLYAPAQSPEAVSRRSQRPSSARRDAVPAPLSPLSSRERALQLLSRFTFGPRPGELQGLLAQGADGPSQWFEQQLNPDAIPDTALNKRLADYPTLLLQPAEALALFPDRGFIQQVAEGKRPYPADGQLTAMYEVQVAKYQRDTDEKKTLASGQPAHPELVLSDEAKAAQKKLDQAAAARIAGDLFALPKDQRMAALLKLPVPDRVAFTGNVSGDQKNLLLSQFSPRERELFNAMSSGPGTSYQIISELSQAKLLRSVLSERQLQEVMTDFWFNHFNVFIGKDADQWYTTTYERDVIRKHALGHFRDLLLATAESPAMLVYLDNWLSVGPNSLANGVNPANPKLKRGNKGLNENYGREVMELHTLGVNGGYTQADVTALSAILTGWTVEKPNLGGPFVFDPKRHEPGPKRWLGHTIVSYPVTAQPHPGTSIDPGQREGLEALSVLAQSPKTARFISFLLAQRFVADDPPPALVDRLAASYMATDGDIKAVLRTLVQGPEFNSRRYFRNKVKTPLEFVASAFRTTGTDPTNPGALVNTLKQMGMPVYYALPPTGYYITADKWMNSTALVDRLNFAYSLTANKYSNQKFDSPRLLALGLMAQPAMGAAQADRAGQGRPANASYRPLGEAWAIAGVESPAAGSEIVAHVLEQTLIGTEASPETNGLIRKQIAGLATASTQPMETLNLLTALILGSPEFQRR